MVRQIIRCGVKFFIFKNLRLKFFFLEKKYLERLAHLLPSFLQVAGGLYSTSPGYYCKIRRYKTSFLKKHMTT